MSVNRGNKNLAQGKLESKCKKKKAESFAEVILNLGWFVDTAVVSEVLLFRLHIIYGLLLGSVLQPRDGAADPFQQLEAERKQAKII